MGMYDNVNVKLKCPNCGEELTGFQSKDGDCCLNTIDPIYVNNFYTNCYNCSSWIEYSRITPQEEIKPRDEPFSLEEIEALGFELNTKPRYGLAKKGIL